MFVIVQTFLQSQWIEWWHNVHRWLRLKPVGSMTECQETWYRNHSGFWMDVVSQKNLLQTWLQYAVVLSWINHKDSKLLKISLYNQCFIAMIAGCCHVEIEECVLSVLQVVMKDIIPFSDLWSDIIAIVHLESQVANNAKRWWCLVATIELVSGREVAILGLLCYHTYSMLR